MVLLPLYKSPCCQSIEVDTKLNYIDYMQCNAIPHYGRTFWRQGVDNSPYNQTSNKTCNKTSTIITVVSTINININIGIFISIAVYIDIGISFTN